MTDEERIELEDKELIGQMALKNARALDKFYDRYNRVAFTLIIRIVRIREDAEDVLVDVFWQIWQQSGRYNPSRGRPLAWLLTIARTRAIDFIRSSRRRPEGQYGVESGGPSVIEERRSQPPKPDPFVLAGTRSAVGKCLDALPPEQRIVLEMAYFEGMTHSEIAASLDQPLGTMKDRIRNGMIRLRKCLKPFEVSA